MNDFPVIKIQDFVFFRLYEVNLKFTFLFYLLKRLLTNIRYNAHSHQRPKRLKPKITPNKSPITTSAKRIMQHILHLLFSIAIFALSMFASANSML